MPFKWPFLPEAVLCFGEAGVLIFFRSLGSKWARTNFSSLCTGVLEWSGLKSSGCYVAATFGDVGNSVVPRQEYDCVNLTSRCCKRCFISGTESYGAHTHRPFLSHMLYPAVFSKTNTWTTRYGQLFYTPRQSNHSPSFFFLCGSCHLISVRAIMTLSQTKRFRSAEM